MFRCCSMFHHVPACKELTRRDRRFALWPPPLMEFWLHKHEVMQSRKTGSHWPTFSVMGGAGEAVVQAVN